jgi:SET domain
MPATSFPKGVDTDNDNDDNESSSDDSDECLRLFLGGIGPGDLDAETWDELEDEAVGPAPHHPDQQTSTSCTTHHEDDDDTVHNNNNNRVHTEGRSSQPTTTDRPLSLSSLLSSSHDHPDDHDGGVVTTAPATGGDETTGGGEEHNNNNDHDDWNTIFSHAYRSGRDGRMERPPVQVTRIPGRGHGLIIVARRPPQRSIIPGDIIFTERAVVAAQTNHDDVAACQSCFRSLVPPPTVFPNADQLWGCIIPPGPEVTVCCCPTCAAPFCSNACRYSQWPAQQASPHDNNTCCRFRRVISSSSGNNNETTTTTTTEAAIRLSIQLFVQLLHQYRKTDEQSGGGVIIDYSRGLCGHAEDCTQLLDFGDDVTHHYYQRLVHEWRLTEKEQDSLSITTFRQLTAIAARNGVGIRTQSPFSPYYAAILRRFGRNSMVHQQLQQAVIQVLLSSTTTTLSSPNQQVEEEEPSNNQEQPADTDDDHAADQSQPKTRLTVPTLKLRRGMDRELNDRYAPELVGLFPLLARINHSCDPNAQIVSQTFVDCHVDLVALRTIAIGEEVTISYLPPHIQRVAVRKKLLQSRYLFDCRCTRCVTDEQLTAS